MKENTRKNGNFHESELKTAKKEKKIKKERKPFFYEHLCRSTRGGIVSIDGCDGFVSINFEKPTPPVNPIVQL